MAEWVDNAPTKYGLAAGTWQLDAISAMLYWELNVKGKPRTLRRVLKSMGRSYTKAMPVQRKSATKEEREEFMSETNATLEELIAKWYVMLCEDKVGVLRWNGRGYGRRRAGGRDTVKTTFSWHSVKRFGALGRDGFYMRPADALNSETFIEFLKELRQTHPKFVIMLDNAASQIPRGAPVHRVGRRERQTGTSAPARPQMNPIEVQYMVLKRLLAGRYLESVDDLRDAITQTEMRSVEIKGYVT